ncbi:MAG TPA: hypothetical protein VKU02_02730 [Gemmataceae bacterium]|nr:hypothetical protein [Gemmataceae bacterium]
MRILRQMGPWLVAVPAVLVGCSRPASPAHKASLTTSVAALPAAAQVVLTVEGMT